MIFGEKKGRVAVVGTGPAGLLAIKYALDYGFEPVAFEKNSEIGGIWNLSDGATWNEMTTNISKYTCSFFGYPWPEGSPLFPDTKQMNKYLLSYAETHKLLNHINFSSKVVHIQKISSEQKTIYSIKYEKSLIEVIEDFQYVVISSGVFNHQSIPRINGLNQFEGRFIHSKSYKSGQEYRAHKVLVVGGSLSGIQIVSNVSKYSESVVHSFTKPFWILKHEIGPQDKKLPIDLTYTRQFYLGKNNQNQFLMRQKNEKFSKTVCKEQQSIEQLRIDESMFSLPIYNSISSDYINQFNLKKIRPLRSSILKIEGKSVRFLVLKTNGEKQKEENLQMVEQFDDIIFCTGFKTDLHYLSKQMQGILQYREEDRLQQIILYKQMFHPDLDNMFFIGMYNGAYFPVLELQVKVAFEYFSGNRSLPSKQQIYSHISKQRQIRNRKVRPQFPHPDYVRFADQISLLAGNKIQIEKLIAKLQEGTDQKQCQIYRQFLKMPVLPTINECFTTNDIERQIQETNKIVKKVLEEKMLQKMKGQHDN